MIRDLAKFFAVLWIVSVLASLAVAGLGLYVIGHFVVKYW